MDSNELKWMSRFIDFLKKEEAWDKYNEELDHAKVSVKENLPTCYILEPFSWSDSVYGELFWRPVHDKWKAIVYRTDMEEIKTFEDACARLYTYDPFMIDLRNSIGSSKEVEAYLKLRIICRALNGNELVSYNKDEKRFNPMFTILKFEEAASDRTIKLSNGKHFTCVAAQTTSAFINSTPFPLSFKSYDLALYCGRQFLELWKDYLIPDE